MNNDLISRSELKEAIEKYRPISTVKSTFIDGRHSMFMDCISEIDKAPTVAKIDTNDIEYKAYCKGLEDGKKIARPQGEFTTLEQTVIADSINYLLGAELLEENGYTEEVVNALKSVLQKIGAEENHFYLCESKRPHGEWIKWNFKTFGPMGDWEYKCSNCEKVYGGEYNFCPNCGSDLRGETYETD